MLQPPEWDFLYFFTFYTSYFFLTFKRNEWINEIGEQTKIEKGHQPLNRTHPPSQEVWSNHRTLSFEANGFLDPTHVRVTMTTSTATVTQCVPVTKIQWHVFIRMCAYSYTIYMKLNKFHLRYYPPGNKKMFLRSRSLRVIWKKKIALSMKKIRSKDFLEKSRLLFT